MKFLRAAIFAVLFLNVSAPQALAEDVTLTSRDGSVKIVGTLVGYDGEFYRVDTEYGVLTIDGSGVLCDGPGCPDLQAFVAEFSISGARTMGEVLMPALVETFAQRNGYSIARNIIDDTHFGYVLTDIASERVAARIGFRVTSTAEGFADLLAGEADIVLSTRQANPSEIRIGQEAGIGDLTNPRRSRIIALDAMVPIVARGNRLDGLTFEELSKIYSGEIANWASLGGPDAPIALHLRGVQSGLSDEFKRRVMLPFKAAMIPAVTRHASNADLSRAVGRDPFSIGMAALSELGNARPVPIKGVCGKVLVANEMSLKTEDYPLTAPLFIYTPARRLSVLAREFLSFARSPAAQGVVQRAGFIDLRLDAIPVDHQGQRLANAITAAGDETSIEDLQRMVQRMHGTARLALSFRFEPGGIKLDAQSRSNIEILAQQLERGVYDEHTLIFAGFSDGVGAADVNLRLAKRRAESVRRAVLRAAPTVDRDRLDLQIDAFGEAMPMACDDSDWGRSVNRRVEVWETMGVPN